MSEQIHILLDMLTNDGREPENVAIALIAIVLVAAALLGVFKD